MNKLFTKIVGGIIGLTMAIGVGVAIGNNTKMKVADAGTAEETTVYTFTSKTWTATSGGNAANWTSGKAGTGFQNNGIQVTTTDTGANGTSPISFTDVSRVVLTYNTNKSAGEGSFDLKIGTNAASSLDWAHSTGDGRTANYTATKDYTTPQSGSLTITINTTTNSCFLVSVSVTHQVDTTVTGVSLNNTWKILPEDSTNFTLTPTITPSVATNKNVSWNSSNTEVATVSNGVVTAVAPGYTTITVTTEESACTATCVVVVTSDDHDGTASHPFTVSDAANVCLATGTTATSIQYYTVGTVSTVTITTKMNGTITDNSSTLTLYNLKDEGNIDFSNTSKVRVDDEITIFSKLVNYKSGGNYTKEAMTGYLTNVVSPITLDSVVISGSITAPQYVGMSWDISELIVYANYSDESQVNVTAGATITLSPTIAPESAGATSLTVSASYNDVDAVDRVFNLTVLEFSNARVDTIQYSSLVFAENPSSYTSFTTEFLAGYTGQANYGVDYVQIRSNNPSGIVSTVKGGKRLARIQVAWDASNTSGRRLTIYGSNTAYSNGADLYDTEKRGTSLGTITYGTSLSLVVTGDYEYVGIKSDGAAYLTSIKLVWELYTASEFSSQFMHMGDYDSELTGAETGYCKDQEHGYYAKAKDAFSNYMTSAAKTDFLTNYANAVARLASWASANGETFNTSTGAFSSNATIRIVNFNNNNSTIIIVLVSVMTISLAGGYFLFKKKKQ